jgi:transcriptional regulator with XRE-family HTH domain
MPSEMPEQTFAERLRLAMDSRGLNANQLAIRAGVAPAYFATAFKRNTRTVSQDQAKKLAPALGVRAAWLMSGEPPMTGPGDEPLPHPPAVEPTPHTPPVKSDTRLISSHWDTPEVEGWFASAIRHAAHEPTGKQITVSKVFTREKMTKMVDGVDMVGVGGGAQWGVSKYFRRIS